MTRHRVWEALAPGKVNVCLYVGEPRADGLHPLVTVIQPLTLADTVRLEIASDIEADEVVCAGVPDESLATRALASYRAQSGWDGPPVRLTIEKRVPVAGGMGGGSADAAAALRLVSAAAGRPGDPLAAQIAPTLGSDVPAALDPHRALVTGVGERVELLPPPSRRGAVVVPAGRPLRTEDVYREFDRLGLGRPPAELDALEAAIRTGSAGSQPLAPEFMFNDLAQAAISLLPEIADTIDHVCDTGSDHAVVSGSGPTVVGLFLGASGPERARVAAERLRRRYPGATAAEMASAAYAAAHPVGA